jgi:hypothetical protein
VKTLSNGEVGGIRFEARSGIRATAFLVGLCTVLAVVFALFGSSAAFARPCDDCEDPPAGEPGGSGGGPAGGPVVTAQTGVTITGTFTYTDVDPATATATSPPKETVRPIVWAEAAIRAEVAGSGRRSSRPTLGLPERSRRSCRSSAAAAMPS